MDADEFGANRDKALQLPITHVKSSECPRSSNVSEAKSASEKGNVSIKTSRRKSLELKDHISTPKSYKTLTKHGSKVSEKTLNAHSKEYYSFGESTWDLVIFIGTGALGPAGSLQTFLLAVVNVCMQGIFVGIAMQLGCLPLLLQLPLCMSLHSVLSKRAILHEMSCNRGITSLLQK